MLIDLHAHSAGISHCCRIPYDEVIKEASAAGICGIVLTNHYCKAYVKNNDYIEFAKRYIDEYRLAKEFGDKLGFKVFFGVEVTMELYGEAHLLIYGIDENFILENPRLYDLSIEELRSLSKSVGAALVQAHPYRTERNLLPYRYLDGVEVNCHPLYGNSYFSDMKRIADENNLFLTCAGDYHANTYRPICGTYIPDDIDTEAGLSQYLLSENEIKLCIHEPNTDKPFDYVFKKYNAN